MNIGIDIDGVLTELDWFLNTYGEKFFKHRKDKYVLVNKEAYKFSERFNCGREVEYKFWKRYLLYYAKKIPIRENAAATIGRWKSDGNKIYIITGRVLAGRPDFLGKVMRKLVIKWLRKQRVVYDDILFVKSESALSEKTKLCRKLKIDWMLEDDPENVKALKNVCNVICMRANYNKSVETEYKVYDFPEAYARINGEQNDLKILNSDERELLNRKEKEAYFCSLKEYYQKLPFDNYRLEKSNKNIRMMWNTVGRVVKHCLSVRISGNDIETSKPTIYVCNHRSAVDILISYCVLNGKPARFLAKKEYDGRLISKLQRPIGTIFIDRCSKNSGKAAMNLMIQTVLNGGSVYIYPEGTRNRTTELLLTFKFGAVYIAQVTGCPIVPMVITKIGKKYQVDIADEVYILPTDSLEVKKEELRTQMIDMLVKRSKNKQP